MNWQFSTGGNRRAALKGAAGVVFIGLLLLVSRPLGNPLADLSYDFPFLLRADVPVSDVAMIYMDDESHGVLHQNTFERWDRELHGQLIDRLTTEYRPRAVVFDIWFGGRTTNDKALLAAIARATNAGIPVILAGTAETPSYKGAELGVKILPPFKQVGAPLTTGPAFEDQLMWGVVQVGVARDRTTREIFRNPGPEPTLAELAARLTRPGWTNDAGTRRWLNYYGPPGHFDYFSYHRVLDSQKPIPVPALSNKVVFVGANVGLSFTGGTRTDHFATPWSWFGEEKFPGVDLNATAYLNLARRDWLTRMSPGLELLVVVCSGFLLGAGLVQCRPYVATGVGLAAAAVAALLACTLVWQAHVWFAWLIIAGVQVPLALAWSVLAYTRRLTAEKARLETQLSGALATPSAPDRQIIPVRMIPGVPTAPAIPDHTLLRLVGKGAYGEIWLARNAIGTYHAVKILHRATFPSEEPFEREFKGIQKFMPISRAHPGLVHVLHVGRNDEAGYIYYVMETADDETTGQSINPVNYSPRNLSREVSQRGRLPVAECLSLGLQLTAALEQLHSCGLIHRDIKPANIIFVNNAAKFADIGLVTEIASTGREVTYVGTEGYMPPEGPGKPGADVFSLGKVLYVACTGMACADFPALPEGVRDWPDRDQMFELNEIVLKACHEDAGKRYQTAAEMRKDLDQLQQRRTAVTAR